MKVILHDFNLLLQTVVLQATESRSALSYSVINISIMRKPEPITAHRILHFASKKKYCTLTPINMPCILLPNGIITIVVACIASLCRSLPGEVNISLLCISTESDISEDAFSCYYVLCCMKFFIKKKKQKLVEDSREHNRQWWRKNWGLETTQQTE